MMFVNSLARWCCRVAVVGAVLLHVSDQCSAHGSGDVAEQMTEAASRFLKSLDDPQRKQVSIPFESERRVAWHYVPSSMLESRGGRRGLAIKEMSGEQRALAHGLLNTALSHRGYLQAMTVITLESILHDLEGGNPSRDPEMYHVAVFGEPSTKSTWAWSFEGHHLSVNITLVEGQRFSVTPSFVGSNPAVVQKGPMAGLETLADERKTALELVRSLSEEQRTLAVIAEKAPSDILTRAEPMVNANQFQPPKGIPFDKLNADQKQMLLKMVGQYAAKYRKPIIDQIDDRSPIRTGRDMYFAWAGGLESGEGHYYRIQTPDFLFEYDNTQNDANHVHTVWREFDGDFGADLLKLHYQVSPHHSK